MPCRDKKKRAAYQKQYQASHRKAMHATRKRNHERNRRYVEDYKRSHPCIDCKEADPVCLDFDHRDDVKKRINVSRLLSHDGSIESLALEIAKCDIRCANCHRKRTAKQQGWKMYLVA